MAFGTRSKLYASFGALVLFSGAAAEYAIFCLGDVRSHLGKMVELLQSHVRAESMRRCFVAVLPTKVQISPRTEHDAVFDQFIQSSKTKTAATERGLVWQLQRDCPRMAYGSIRRDQT